MSVSLREVNMHTVYTNVKHRAIASGGVRPTCRSTCEQRERSRSNAEKYLLPPTKFASKVSRETQQRNGYQVFCSKRSAPHHGSELQRAEAQRVEKVEPPQHACFHCQMMHLSMSHDFQTHQHQHQLQQFPARWRPQIQPIWRSPLRCWRQISSDCTSIQA